MMNKTRFLMIAVIALVVLNLVSIVALWRRGGRPPVPEGPRKIIVQRLRFDHAQTTAYDLLVEKHRADIRQKDREMADARRALYQLLKGDDFSHRDSLLAEAGRLQMAVEQIHLAHFREIKQLCRPDQIADFNALAGDLAEYFPGRKGR